MTGTRTRRPDLDAPLPATNPIFRAWRLRMGLSQRAAAEALGYSEVNICRFDQGKAALNVTLALAMEALEGRKLGLSTMALSSLKKHQLISADHTGLSPIGALLADIEGWNLFWNASAEKLEIQRCDNGLSPFDDDAAALTHVRQQAIAGSALHRVALSLHGSTPALEKAS